MDSFVLTLAIRWLPAVDALAAVCVSREWREILASERQGGDLWKQVCRNTNPFVVESLMKQSSHINFRAMALGFGRDIPTLPRRLAPATLRSEDLFAVVDLYRRAKVANGKRRKVIEASWVCPVVFPGFDTTNIPMGTAQKMVIHGANPYAAHNRNRKDVQKWQTARSRYSQKSPLHFAAYDVVGASCIPTSRALRAKVTLFRKDDMKSVCIMDEDIVDCATGGDVDPAEEVVRFYYHTRDTIRFANNEKGLNAHLLAKKRAFTRLSLDGEFILKATLPEPGSDGEQPWLANSRHAVRTMGESELYHPTLRDQAALLNISSFQYEVKRFAFVFRVSTDMPLDFWDEFDSEEDMMIALEGMCWQ